MQICVESMESRSRILDKKMFKCIFCVFKSKILRRVALVNPVGFFFNYYFKYTEHIQDFLIVSSTPCVVLMVIFFDRTEQLTSHTKAKSLLQHFTSIGFSSCILFHMYFF